MSRYNETMQKAIIIGATSGIGRALALELSRRGYAVGIAGRREELLREVQEDLVGPSATMMLDVAQPEEAINQINALIAALGGMDLLVISSGVGIPNPELDFPPERDTIAVNVTGFVAMATAGFRYFAGQGGGHLVGISSIAGLRGTRANPAYGASKAFEINYLEALRARARHQGMKLTVTDIRPGFVETPMTHGQSGMFWVAGVEKAARQIADAIARKRRVAYITHRWAIVAWIARHLPAWVLERI